jgi:hypothetical protein
MNIRCGYNAASVILRYLLSLLPDLAFTSSIYKSGSYLSQHSLKVDGCFFQVYQWISLHDLRTALDSGSTVLFPELYVLRRGTADPHTFDI